MYCMLVYGRRQCIVQRFTEALCEKDQTIKTYDAKISKLQLQMEKSDSACTEKDTSLAEYEAIVKETKGRFSW